MSLEVRKDSTYSSSSSGVSLSPPHSPETIADDVYALPKEETLRLRKKASWVGTATFAINNCKNCYWYQLSVSTVVYRTRRTVSSF